MLTTEAEAELKRMLEAEGFDFDQPNPQIAWKVFKAFAQLPVECADDAFLFQCGTFGLRSNDLFYLDFVRQFSIDDADGEYDHMEQLHCRFTRSPDKELKSLDKNLWSYDFKNLNDYLAAAENLSEFQTAIAYRNWKCVIEHEEI